MVSIPHSPQDSSLHLQSWVPTSGKFVQEIVSLVQTFRGILGLKNTLQANYLFYASVSLYFWKLHFAAMKVSNNNFLVGFPTWKLAKIFMLYAISMKYSLPYDEVELMYLELTVKPDPIWKEWEKENTTKMPAYF